MHATYRFGQAVPGGFAEQAGEECFGGVYVAIMRNSRERPQAGKRKPALRRVFHERRWILAFAGMIHLAVDHLILPSL